MSTPGPICSAKRRDCSRPDSTCFGRNVAALRLDELLSAHQPFATIAIKPRSDDNASATTPERTALPEFFSDVQTTPLTPPLRLPNRGHTYLRCCAFLI